MQRDPSGLTLTCTQARKRSAVGKVLTLETDAPAPGDFGCADTPPKDLPQGVRMSGPGYWAEIPDELTKR